MLILNTSAVLNLIGSGKPRLIILNLAPHKVLVPKAVEQEIQNELGDPTSSLAGLISDRVISIIEANAEITELALELAGAPSPDNLDDGESFAIACAACTGAAIGIDDRKARRITADRWPGLEQKFSFDLLAEAAVNAVLSRAEYADLLYCAMKNTRMRIPKESRAAVIQLVGLERARECLSLGTIR